jgi:acetylglutamate/LysW-gamma-L-alpha-aminoadipate kinase
MVPPPIRFPPAIVVKVGGSTGIDRASVAADIASLAKDGQHVVLIHGASAETDALAASLGHPSRTIVSPSGQQSRRTDRRTLEIFAMAALGVETFSYVELLKRAGAQPLGLFGVLVGRRKDVRAVQEGRTILLRDDYTGRVEEIPVSFVWKVLDEGWVPVLPPLALSPEGEGLNVDGDRAAAAIAGALRAKALVILTNVSGLLRSVEDPESLVASATLEEAEALAVGRMKKKVMAAREAADAGVERIVISSGRVDHPVARALAGAGTSILATPTPAR